MLDDDELDDEPVSPLEALIEKSPELQRMLSELAQADMLAWEQERAAPVLGTTNRRPTAGPTPPHILEPYGPRQRKKAARRTLFAALRAGRGIEAACAEAGISAETLDRWREEPSFDESIRHASGYRHVDDDDEW